MSGRLTHIDETGRATMVDVGRKDVTERVAVARGRVSMKPETLQLIIDGGTVPETVQQSIALDALTLIDPIVDGGTKNENAQQSLALDSITLA